MSKALSINDFKWVEDTSEFDESFGKRYNKESDKGHFLWTDVQYPEKLHDVHNNLPFLPETINNWKNPKAYC